MCEKQSVTSVFKQKHRGTRLHTTFCHIGALTSDYRTGSQRAFDKVSLKQMQRHVRSTGWRHPARPITHQLSQPAASSTFS